MTHRKIHGAKSDFGELSIDGLQEDFGDNEKLALDYLNGKFGEEVTEDIKDRIQKTLIVDGKNYDT